MANTVHDDGDDLTALFPAPLPGGIAALDPESKADLAALIREADRVRVEQLVEAATRSLDNIPSFLRGAVRKAAGL